MRRPQFQSAFDATSQLKEIIFSNPRCAELAQTLLTDCANQSEIGEKSKKYLTHKIKEWTFESAILRSPDSQWKGPCISTAVKVALQAYEKLFSSNESIRLFTEHETLKDAFLSELLENLGTNPSESDLKRVQNDSRQAIGFLEASVKENGLKVVIDDDVAASTKEYIASHQPKRIFDYILGSKEYVLNSMFG